MERLDDKAPIFDNLPPIAGALTWIKSLQDRIQDPYEKLLNLDSEITEKEEFKDIQKMYENLFKTLKNYKESKILAW